MPSRAGQRPLEVLYEDNHLLVVNKPAGLATMGVGPEEPSAVRLARDYLKAKYHKPGNVYLGVVSRLDAAVSGVLVLARTSKAAARLAEQFRRRQPAKEYWAIVERPPADDAAELVHWLRKDERKQRMEVVRPHTPGAQRARLSYRVLRPLSGGRALLQVRLETGRKHQIRVQLDHIGAPILGDRKYGSRQPFPAGIALHARRLTIDHPVRKETLELVAPLPALWRKCGVEPDAGDGRE